MDTTVKEFKYDNLDEFEIDAIFKFLNEYGFKFSVDLKRISIKRDLKRPIEDYAFLNYWLNVDNYLWELGKDSLLFPIYGKEKVTLSPKFSNVLHLDESENSNISLKYLEQMLLKEVSNGNLELHYVNGSMRFSLFEYSAEMLSLYFNLFRTHQNTDGVKFSKLNYSNDLGFYGENYDNILSFNPLKK